MDKTMFEEWRRYIPDLGEVLRAMEEKTIIAVGVAPYPRILPSLFLDNYLIYSVKDASDIDILRRGAQIVCLEERNPKLAARVRATGYLVNNYIFQAFLSSRRGPFRLMFSHTTNKTIEAMEAKGWDWIGNRPETFAGLALKGEFRDLVKSLGIRGIPDWRLTKNEFLAKNFQELFAKWNKPVVVQRADFEVGGNFGTFFLNTEDDWKSCHEILANDDRYTTVTISPFITGSSLSMLGCITHQGVLTSTLQLQLIDVPEALHGEMPTGIFLGHDWTKHDWPERVNNEAQAAVEAIGYHLAEKGFRGVFGIDFLYDAGTHEIFPIECNPRFTGALPVMSFMAIANGVPPLEFFHLMSHLDIRAPFDFEGVNRALKKRMPLSHISINPKGIYEMKADLRAGINSYDPATGEYRYERPGAFPWELKGANEFLLLDSIPRKGSSVGREVPGMCKLIFKKGIAESSSKVDSGVAKLLANLSAELKKDQTAPAAAGEEGNPAGGEE